MMHQKDINQIVDILAEQAAVFLPQQFFKDIVDSTDMPGDWKQEIAGIWTGDARTDARKLIEWANKKGRNPQNKDFQTLGSILEVLLPRVGYDIQKEIATIIVENRLYLKRKSLQELIYEYKMEECKLPPNDIDSLGLKNSSQIPDIAIEELAQILEIIKTKDFRIIKLACQRSLPRRAREKTVKVKEISEILELLVHELKSKKDPTLKIREFALRLSEVPKMQELELDVTLNDWFDKYRLDKPTIERSQKLEPRLSIVISPCHSVENNYRVQAWLRLYDSNTSDDDFYKLNFSFLEPQEIKENLEATKNTTLLEKIERQKDFGQASQEIFFSLAEVKDLLILFLIESIKITQVIEVCNCKFFRNSEVTVEFFLPYELLKSEESDVDQWKFYEDKIGSIYKVLIRSEERVKLSTQVKNIQIWNKVAVSKIRKWETWQNNWVRVQNKLQNTADEQDFGFLDCIDNFTETDLENRIINDWIGIKIACSLPIEARKKFLEVAISQAMAPIALWTRCSNSHSTCIQEIDGLARSSLKNLPADIREKREQDPDNLGKRLVLLWDDPNCLPPSDDLFQATRLN